MTILSKLLVSISFLLVIISNSYSDEYTTIYNDFNHSEDYVNLTVSSSAYSTNSDKLDGYHASEIIAISTGLTPTPDLSAYAIKSEVSASTTTLYNQINSTYNYITSNYVPYTGATNNVDLGTHNITVGSSVTVLNANNEPLYISKDNTETKITSYHTYPQNDTFAIRLNGSSGYASIDVSTNIITSGAISWSISATVCPYSLPSVAGCIFNENSSGGADWIKTRLHIDSLGRVVLLYQATPTGSLITAVTSTGTLTVGTTSFLVVTCDTANDRAYVYRDGIQIGSGTVTTGVLTTGKYANLGKSIGRWYNTRYFNGTIDNVAVWSNRVITSTEAVTLYNGGSGKVINTSISPFEWGLSGGWNFDEGSGTNLAVVVSTNANATLVNGAFASTSYNQIQLSKTINFVSTIDTVAGRNVLVFGDTETWTTVTGSSVSFLGDGNNIMNINSRGVGIGGYCSNEGLNINIPDKVGRLNFITVGTSGDSNNFGYLYDGLSDANGCVPAFMGHRGSVDSTSAFRMTGSFLTGADLTGSSRDGALVLQGRVTDGDPLNGTLTQVQNRRLVDILNYATPVWTITASGREGLGTVTPVSKYEVTGGSITISGTNANLQLQGHISFSTVTTTSIMRSTSSVIDCNSGIYVSTNLVVQGCVVSPTGQSKIHMPYGAFYSTTTQSIAVINTTQTITLDGSIDSHAVTYANNCIIPTYSGEYFVSFSALPDGDVGKTIWIFPRINGVNVPYSNTPLTFTADHKVFPMVVSYNFNLNSGDCLELIMYSDDVDTQIVAYPASTTPIAPASPSIIVTINKTGELQ